MVNQTYSKISIDAKQLYIDLIKLLKVPGPTQACVKISKDDPRVTENFPMEKAILKIIKKLNEENDVNLQIIRHNGNLLIVSGMKKYDKIRESDELTPDECKDIKNIQIVLGAHLDEISYMITKKKEKKSLNEKAWYVIPLCAPPQLFRGKYEHNSDKTKRFREVLNPDVKIVGFRNKKFVTDIGFGICYKADELIEDKIKSFDEEGEINKVVITRKWKQKSHFLLKVIKEIKPIKEGDIVIQDYGEWKNNSKFDNSNQLIFSKALDDRVGCIATIYALKELSKQKIKSKAILTSAEEGVPKDISWGRLIRPTYEKFCRKDGITLICDGVDGARMDEFEEENNVLSKAIIVPYTSAGKGGGDIGLFSRFRDKIIPELYKIYGEEIAVTSTDYASRSYDIKIMDDWTTIGFIQWSCGEPTDPQSICHNKETVSLQQIINIIRTMCHSFKILSCQ
ncbi:MAG: hypothetical protein MUO82_02565 [Candidatus Thermoplasmatota archaeon]|nr:hypothetical protein [Candidatus Thermoplasmatota archaeon]